MIKIDNNQSTIGEYNYISIYKHHLDQDGNETKTKISEIEETEYRDMISIYDLVALNNVSYRDLERILASTRSEHVDHPSHYNREGAMETIDEMIVIFGKAATRMFCILNAWKYRSRALEKNGEEDLAKSDWYIRKARELDEIRE